MERILLSLLLAAGCGTSVRVIDGDTLVVGQETVRLLGIDCPETTRNARCRRQGERCEAGLERGQQAKAYLTRAVDSSVVVERHGQDRYGRTLGYVSVAGRDLGHELLVVGLCDDVGDRYPHPRLAQYRD
jgi:micrococcal nuclease